MFNFTFFRLFDFQNCNSERIELTNPICVMPAFLSEEKKPVPRSQQNQIGMGFGMQSQDEEIPPKPVPRYSMTANEVPFIQVPVMIQETIAQATQPTTAPIQVTAPIPTAPIQSPSQSSAAAAVVTPPTAPPIADPFEAIVATVNPWAHTGWIEYEGNEWVDYQGDPVWMAAAMNEEVPGHARERSRELTVVGSTIVDGREVTVSMSEKVIYGDSLFD
jgi:hypothetical protein